MLASAISPLLKSLFQRNRSTKEREASLRICAVDSLVLHAVQLK